MTLTVILIVAVMCDLVQRVKREKDISFGLMECVKRAFVVFSLVYMTYMAGKAIGVTWWHEIVECLCLMVEGSEILGNEETTRE